jgi:hypothetical protein
LTGWASSKREENLVLTSLSVITTKPYATSHTTLDTDDDMQKEVVNVALAIANAVTAIRAGKFEEPDVNLEAPRAK